jgi:hypothetical protein
LCHEPPVVFVPSNSWWIVGGGIRDLNWLQGTTTPYIQWGRQLLESKGINYRASGNFGLGFDYAYPMIQAIRTGDVIDLSGKTKPCAFDQSASTCS